MGLLDSLKSVIFRNKQTEKRTNNFLSAMTSRGSSSGMVVTDDTAMNFTAVWAAIRILSESIAQLPLSVYEEDKQGNKAISKKHQLYNLILRKNYNI